LTYSQVACGSYHTVLLRSDGSVVACGDNLVGQCSIPRLEGGMTYLQVAAGHLAHTVLLRSDGDALAIGQNTSGECSIGSWSEVLGFSKRVAFVPDVTQLPFHGGNRVVQLHLSDISGTQCHLVCTSLAGGTVCRLSCERSDCIAPSLQRQIAQKIKVSSHCLKIVLPDATLLGSLPPSEDVLSKLPVGQMPLSTEACSFGQPSVLLPDDEMDLEASSSKPLGQREYIQQQQASKSLVFVHGLRILAGRSMRQYCGRISFCILLLVGFIISWAVRF